MSGGDSTFGTVDPPSCSGVSRPSAGSPRTVLANRAKSSPRAPAGSRASWTATVSNSSTSGLPRRAADLDADGYARPGWFRERLTPNSRSTAASPGAWYSAARLRSRSRTAPSSELSNTSPRPRRTTSAMAWGASCGWALSTAAADPLPSRPASACHHHRPPLPSCTSTTYWPSSCARSRATTARAPGGTGRPSRGTACRRASASCRRRDASSPSFAIGPAGPPSSTCPTSRRTIRISWADAPAARRRTRPTRSRTDEAHGRGVGGGPQHHSTDEIGEHAVAHVTTSRRAS